MNRPSAALHGALVGIATLAVAIPAAVVSNPPTIVRRVPARLPAQRVVPQAEVPPVEPVKFVDLTPEDARAFNATVPFSTDPNPAARPFRFAGSAEDKSRATDCLAAGVIYEAGDDAPGERAVAQVVLNRLRHPAFAKSVCGVVFEGAERATGCQFTFTCDGALDRWKPTEAGWRRAREIATAALSGSVYKPVGYATHYHTDWVVPYWQSSLDKVAAVESHLFFRWSGWWGTPPAFNRHQSGAEPALAKMAALSDAHRLGAAIDAATAAGADATQMAGIGPQAMPADPNTFLTVIDPAQSSDTIKAMALVTCGDRSLCRVMGWTKRSAMATAMPPTPDQVAALSFSYLRDRAFNYEKTLWNCEEYKRADPAECLRRQSMRAEAPAVPQPAPTSSQQLKLPKLLPELGGVRRKDEAPAPLPSPSPTR